MHLEREILDFAIVIGPILIANFKSSMAWESERSDEYECDRDVDMTSTEMMNCRKMLLLQDSPMGDQY